LAKTDGKAAKRAAKRTTVRRRGAAAASRLARRAPARDRAAAARGGLPAGGLIVGSVARCDAAGVWVQLPGGAGPVLARAMLPAGALPVRLAPRPGQEVVLMLEPGAARPPVLLGLLQPLGAEPGAPAAAESVRAQIDGRLELDARDEIVLRCGEATIVLRANGRVVVRGATVETRARGVNRIKGGSVSIN
jgi:hypothetical protein